MKHYSKLFKRVQAWVLTVAMLLPLVNSGLLLGISAADETLPVRDKVVTTEGKIVADNYELSEAEEALLASGLLVGKTISIEKPNDTDELISVDSDTHAIKAVEFPDENGYVWKPVVARIMVGEAEKETVELTNGEGTYEYDGNAFSVHVDYEVRVDVSADKQNSLLNAGAALRNDMDACVGNMEAIDSIASSILDILASDLSVLEGLSPMEVLVRMASEEGLEITSIEILGAHPTIKFAATTDASQEERDAAIAAVGELDRQKTANNGKFDLSVALAAYGEANKVKYFVSGQQEAVKSTLKETRDQIESIHKVLTYISNTWSNIEVEGAAELVDNLVTLTNKLGSWVTKVDDLMAKAEWNATMANPFRENLTEQDWAEAEDLVNALEADKLYPAQVQKALDELKIAISEAMQGYNFPVDTLNDAIALAERLCPDAEALENAKKLQIKESLVAATTTLRHNMSMFDVKVTVSLNLTTGNGESYAPYDKIVKTATVTLAENAPKDEIIAAIAATGVEDAAINAWIDAGVYVAGQFNTAGAVGVPETLTQDTHVSITYSPNKYSVELQYNDEVKELYYNAFVDLPVHGDSAKSYDYLVNGVKHYQGDRVSITEDTVITRTEGKAYVGTPLNQLVSSVIFADNKNAAAILNSGALTIGNENQLIRYPDAGLVVYDKTTGTLTATSYPSGYQDLNWVPDTYTIFNNGDAPVTKDYEGRPIDLSAIEYDRVTVSFKLDLPEDGVLDLVTLPYDLWNDVQDQQAAMNKLSAQKDNLGLLNRSLVSMVKNSLTDDSASAEDKALAAIFDRMLKDPACMGTEYFVLYELLENYDGMAYYYANNVKFRETVAVLEQYLADIIEYKTVLNDLLNGFSNLLPAGKTPDEIISKIDTLKDTMEQLSSELKPVDSRVDVSKDLDALLNALSAKTNPFTDYGEVAPDFFLTRDFSVDAPDKATIKVILTGGDKVDVEISKTFDIDYALQQGDVDAIAALVEEAIRNRDVDAFFYEYKMIELPVAGTVMAEGGIELTITWTPKTFKVVVNGETQTITILDRVVNLPASTDPDFRYDYYLGDQKLNVVDGKYTFTGVEETFKTLFATGTCEITLDPVNIADELAAAMDAELLSFVNGLNDSIGDGGMSFALVKNNGKYSVIMKIDGSQPNALAGAVQGLAMGFVTSGYSTIAMDNKGVFADSQISLQALIDAIMNSGFSTDDLQYAVDADGDIIEFNLPGTVLTGDKALGGKLITTTMQLTKGDTTREMDFYITLSSASDEITQIRNLMAGQLKGYFSVDFANGKSTVNLTIPEKAYEAYLAGLLVTGYLDIRDINAMEAQIAGKFMFDVVHPLFGEDSDIDTLKNTLKLFGFASGELSRDELATLFNLVRDRHENVYTSITFDETTGEITKTISIKGLLGSMNLPENLTGFIKEYDTGITITGATAFPQMGTDYEAAYVDVRAESALDMIGLLKKGQLANKKLSGASIVVLLDNITGNLTFDKTTVLNLNGFTVNGNVTSTGNLTIVDSCLEQNGSVTGTVSGNVTALSGRYTYSLDADMLKAGYEQDSFGVVHNKFYNFVKDGEGNITIEINAGLLNLSHYDGEIPDVKFMVLDLAVDMFFNGYTTNHLEIDGNLVYHLGVNDFVGLYTGEDRKQELIDAVRNMFDAQAIVNIMNLIIDDVTDFDALYEALANDQPLFSYDLTTGSWKIVTGRIDNGDNDYFTIGIGSGDTELGEYKTRKLNVKIVYDKDEDKQHLLDILEQLRDTTDIDINLRPVEGAYDAADKDLVLGWGGSGSVLIDFTKNDNYAVLFGVLLADGLKGTATSDKLVAAIREYYETDNIYALKVAFNAVTVSQLLDTFMDYNRSSDVKEMINALGLTDVVSDEVNELEDLFDRYAKVLTAVARRIDNRFDLPESGRTLGSFFNATLGGYGFSRDNIEKNVKRDVLRGFGVDLTAKVDHVSVVIRIFADDLPPVEDKIDYTELLNALEAAKPYLSEEYKYTVDTWNAFIDAYNAALDALNSLDQNEVNTKAADLYAAIGALKEKEAPVEIDYTDLDRAIEAAKEYLDREADFLAEAWEKFETAYNRAVDVRENSVDQEEVDKAAKDLWDAIAYLVENPVPEEDELDYSELENKINEAEGKDESLFTPDSWAAMQAVLAEAKAMLENKSAENQDQIDAMVAKLDDAIKALVVAGGSEEEELDYSELESKINEAEALNESTYTPDSWNAMQAVLAEAKAMLENKSAETQDEIDAMVAKLDKAIEDLDEPDEPDQPVDTPVFKDEDNKITFESADYESLASITVKGNLFVADVHRDGMTIGEFIEIMKANMTAGLEIECYKADGTTKIADMNMLVFTGATFKIMMGTEVIDTFIAAVLGDLDGDGKQSAKDTYLTKWNAANDVTLPEHLSAASDYNDDGVYNAKDSYLAAYKAAHWEDYKATAES